MAAFRVLRAIVGVVTVAGGCVAADGGLPDGAGGDAAANGDAGAVDRGAGPDAFEDAGPGGGSEPDAVFGDESESSGADAGGSGDSEPAGGEGCVVLSPEAIDFGAVPVGTWKDVKVVISPCAGGGTTVTSLGLAAGSSPAFEIVSHDFGDVFPVYVPPGAQKFLHVRFEPADLDLVTGAVEVGTTTGGASVPLSGTGVAAACPQAVIDVGEGLEVVPQTVLHLGAAGSSPSVAAYHWTVQQPEGSTSTFVPASNSANPVFEVNVAGVYVFSLEVWDEKGVKSCVADHLTVFVYPEDAIHVELLWHTPNDPDETDEGFGAGADLDLHFLHPAAFGDGWFDQPFDCFWFNANPSWGSLDPNVDDDPSLDRDDTDGAGPENLNLNLPEDGLEYCIGVHVWNDHAFGSSFATVRVYVYGVLAFEEAGVELWNHDLWEVACIDWPSATITPIFADGGGWKIHDDYENSFFPTD